MWDKCPKCGSNGNFMDIKEQGHLGTVETIKCPKCGFEKDISCPELW